MNERMTKNKASGTPPQATQANSPLLHRSSLTDEQSESVGSNSNISKELGKIQPKPIRRSLNWQNITVEAPSRGNGMSLPGGIQRQQEEPATVSGERVSADSAQKSALELSNSTISTSEPAQKPSISRAPFNGRNISVEAPPRSATSSTYPGEIQRLETSEVKKQAESIGESVNVKEEVDKASSPEPSYLFRADDNYKIGDPVGLELDSEEATTADIQDPLDHVLNKESGQTSRYVSFSSAITIPGGGGPKKFTKKNKILKAAWEAVQQLASDGKIRIYTPEQVAEMIRNNPKKKISKQANNVKVAMEKNGEILVEGQIPGNLIAWAK